MHHAPYWKATSRAADLVAARLSPVYALRCRNGQSGSLVVAKRSRPGAAEAVHLMLVMLNDLADLGLRERVRNGVGVAPEVAVAGAS